MLRVIHYMVNKRCILNISLSHTRSLRMAPFNRSHTSSYQRYMVTMALLCIISEMKRDIGQTSQFFYTSPAFDVPVRVPARHSEGPAQLGLGLRLRIGLGLGLGILWRTFAMADRNPPLGGTRRNTAIRFVRKTRINNTNQLIKTTFKKFSKIDTFNCPSKTNQRRKVNCTR